MRKIILENEDLDNLINAYRELKSIKRVGEKFGISCPIVTRELKKAITIDNRYSYKYTCDNSFFSRDTPESFYWAGFIAADGCIKDGKGNKTVCIDLSRKDEQHLYKFKKSVAYTGIIGRVVWKSKNLKDRKGSSIRITSAEMADDLKRFNIVPRKTHIYTFPKWLVNHSLVNHFMRGYFDGDGSFYSGICKPGSISGNITPQLNFELVGASKGFVETYKLLLTKHCDINPNKKIRKKIKGRSNPLYSLAYSGNKMVPKIRDFLYKNSLPVIRLDRKYNIAHDEKYTRNCRIKAVIGINIETQKEIFFKKMVDANSFGFSFKQIYKCCKGKRKTHKGYRWRYATEEETNKRSKI